jgi:hypothetical protein
LQQKSFSEKTSADSKSIGFEFQYYFFLYTVLGLKVTESAGLEVFDDVHTQLSNNRQILIQLKHTVQLNAQGTPINITQFDHSLWKTLSNWSKIISDKSLGRSDITQQVAFINKTDFLLVTNKSASSHCDFLNILEEPTIAIPTLNRLKTETKDQQIIEYINDLLALDDSVLLSFMRNIKIESDVNDIINLCYERIKEKFIPADKVEEVFRNLDSAIRQDNYMLVKANQKIVITFEEFFRKYRKYFDIGRTDALVLRSLYTSLPSDLENQTFIKQLIEIGDLSETDKADMAEFTKFKLFVEANINKWLEDGHLTNQELEIFKNNVILKWSNSFRSKHRHSKSDNCTQAAIELLDELRQDILSIGGQPMDLQFSNGQYYLLSDEPLIGWHLDWKRMYV